MKDRKKEIIDGAIKIISENGYSNTRISDIVKEVGIAQGTFYNYFSSKKELFIELIDEFNKLLIARIRNIDIKDINETIELENKIKLLYRAIFETYRDNARLAKVMLREAVAIDKDFEKKKKELYDLSSIYIKKTLAYGVDNQLIYDYDADIISSAIIGMAENVAHDFLVDNKDYDLDKLINNMARFETHGLLKR